MKLSIIIPCYNEGKDIFKKTEEVKQYLSSKKINYELILVNDGSKDNTGAVIKSIEGINAVGYKDNRGKGGAIKEGIMASTGDYILFMDADLSTDLSAIDQVINQINNKEFIIIGSRHTKGSLIKIKQPIKRRLIGLFCRILVNLNFGLRLKDSQCGFKCFETNLAKKIASKQIINGFAFDVEYLYIAKLNNINIKEIPVIWSDDRGSSVTSGASFRFIKEMKKIKRNKNNYCL